MAKNEYEAISSTPVEGEADAAALFEELRGVIGDEYLRLCGRAGLNATKTLASPDKMLGFELRRLAMAAELDVKKA